MQRTWTKKCEKNERDENQETGISKREGENIDIMYTPSKVRAQTEVSRNNRSKKGLNEGLELDVQSRYNRMFESECYRRQDDGLVGPMYFTFSNIR